MIFEDNVLKEYLSNVYFIAGTPCGGKTTVSHILGERHGISVYDADEHFDAHRGMSDSKHQPAMNTSFADADEFFARSADEYLEWLTAGAREQLDFMLLDLIRISADKPVICDCVLTIEELRALSDPSRVAFMIKEPVMLADEYCGREDHRDYRDWLYSASDVEGAKALCSETLMRLNMPFYKEVRQSGYFFIDRSEGLDREQCAERTAEHFGWR